MRAKTPEDWPVRGRWMSLFQAAGLLFGSWLLTACGGPVDADAPENGAAVASDAAATSEALRAGRAGRPAGVPTDYVATPHGYFHPSCVVEVGDDEQLGEDGALTRPDGRRRDLSSCRHARFDRRGRFLGGGADASTPAPPPTVNGWVASYSSTSVGPVRSIAASWRVPQPPSLAGTQTLYFFPGLEPAATGDIILQPVLAWNGYNDQAWTITSWNCCKDANVLHSRPRTVRVGETISGTVSGSRCNAQGVCSSWTVRTTSSSGVSTTLSTSSYGEVLDWVFGGAVEAYGTDSCSQYPGNGQLAFTSIVVRRFDGVVSAPTWVPMSYGGSPDCMARVDNLGGSGVAFNWATQ